MEVWKDIEGYEGLYQISNLGRVKSLERKIKRRNDRIQTVKERILKLNLNKEGYHTVKLHKKGKGKTYLVHRLVANTFITNPDNKLEVNHINGVKNDNNVNNLEWNTRKENMRHAVDNRLHDQKGSKSNTAKLTEEQVLEIMDSNSTCRALAKMYGVNKSTINRIKRRRTWSHI